MPLDRHGLVTVGTSVGDATAIAEELELAARMHFPLDDRVVTPLTEAERTQLG